MKAMFSEELAVVCYMYRPQKSLGKSARRFHNWMQKAWMEAEKLSKEGASVEKEELLSFGNQLVM